MYDPFVVVKIFEFLIDFFRYLSQSHEQKIRSFLLIMKTPAINSIVLTHLTGLYMSLWLLYHTGSLGHLRCNDASRDEADDCELRAYCELRHHLFMWGHVNDSEITQLRFYCREKCGTDAIQTPQRSLWSFECVSMRFRSMLS